jgi:truncated hemoglobin YjbI
MTSTSLTDADAADAAAANPSPAQVTRKPSLMDRLGGNEAVKAAVDGLYKRLLADPALAPFFETVNMARLRQHQIRFMKIAFDQVPEDMDVIAYMARSHAFMIEEKGLNATHFDKVAGHFVDTLKELKVSEDLIDEALGVIGPLRVVFESKHA